MIHPSYNELIEIINKGNEDGSNPVINSRYSIVMAAARRARQLIEGEDPLVPVYGNEKALSIAVEEIRSGKIKITEEGVDDFDLHLKNSSTSASDLAYDEESLDGETEEESESGEDAEEDDSEDEDAE